MGSRDPYVTHTVDTPSGPLSIHAWEPAAASWPALGPTLVTVHPWAVLGGSEGNCVGVAKRLADKGLRTLTFNLRSSSMVWGVLSNHRSEVAQVRAVLG